jgi:hypothetical protein
VVLDKFNVYDFLGYLIPGATVVLTIYWVGKWAFGVPFPDLQTDLSSSIFFIGLSYVVGHFVQGFGSMYETWLNGKWKPPARLSERLLWQEKDNGVTPDQQLAPQVVPQVVSAAEDVFKLAAGDANHAAVFEQCYALVTQQGLGQLTAVYLALNGLARGMLIATIVGFLAGLAIVLKQIVLIVGGGGSSTGTWTVSYQQLVLGLVVMLTLIPVALLLIREFNRFRGYFARSVYYNFLAWYSAKNFSPADTPGFPGI